MSVKDSIRSEGKQKLNRSWIDHNTTAMYNHEFADTNDPVHQVILLGMPKIMASFKAREHWEDTPVS